MDSAGTWSVLGQLPGGWSGGEQDEDCGYGDRDPDDVDARTIRERSW